MKRKYVVWDASEQCWLVHQKTWMPFFSSKKEINKAIKKENNCRKPWMRTLVKPTMYKLVRI